MFNPSNAGALIAWGLADNSAGGALAQLCKALDRLSPAQMLLAPLGSLALVAGLGKLVAHLCSDEMAISGAASLEHAGSIACPIECPIDVRFDENSVDHLIELPT